MKRKIVVYGLGNNWEKDWRSIEERYAIVGCCDREVLKAENTHGYPFISKEMICNAEVEYILITASNFGMKAYLNESLGIELDRILMWEDEKYGKSTWKERSVAENKDLITIIIPTYNRRESLIKTLAILEKQVDNYCKVIVVDNASDYDVEAVRLELGDRFNEILEIHRNKLNIGMCGNLANIFAFAEGEWVWTLSDDDLVEENAIKIIRDTISHNSDYGVFMFALTNVKNRDEDDTEIKLDSIDQLLDFYKRRNAIKWDPGYSGDFIFLSNKVFKADICKKYITGIFRNTISGMPQIYPILKGLSDNIIKMVISDYKIVNHKKDSTGHWNYFDIGIGSTTVLEWDLKYDSQYFDILCNLVVIPFFYIKGANNRKLSVRERTILEIMFERAYRYVFSEEDKKEFENYISS